MAAPSLAEVQTQWSNAVELLEETRKWAQVNGENWVSKEDTFVQAVESDFASEILTGAARSRAFLAALLSNANVAQHLLPHLKSYCRHITNTPSLSDSQKMIDEIVNYMYDNSLTVNSRDFVFATPSMGGGNAGNGTILRLNTDDHNFSIENQHADAKRADCRFDRNTGTNQHEELFEFRGQAPGIDSLQVSGSNKRRFIASLSARNSLLSNPSFSQLSGTAAAPTAITGWTSSVTVNSTNYNFDATNYYRDFRGDTIPYALNIKAVSSNLTQKLSVLNTKLKPNVPYMLQVAWNRQVGTGAGTLLIRMGALSNSVVVAAQTGWNLLRVPTTFGQNNWYRQFDEQDMDITIEWTRTSGDLLIDDVLLVPATDFDGSWYWMVGGSTPFLKDDSATWSDTETGAIHQRFVHRGFGRYLPSATAAAETWVDP
jgi:hypothetical protein